MPICTEGEIRMATKKVVAKAAEVKAAPVKEEVKVAPVKTEEVKKEVKAEEKAPAKAPAKKAVAKAAPAKKAEVKKEEVKKEAVKAPAKKAPAKKAEVKVGVCVQFAGKSYTTEELVKIAKDVWKYDLKQKAADFKSVELYVKPEEAKVYYVINEKEAGSFDI